MSRVATWGLCFRKVQESRGKVIARAKTAKFRKINHDTRYINVAWPAHQDQQRRLVLSVAEAVHPPSDLQHT